MLNPSQSISSRQQTFVLAFNEMRTIAVILLIRHQPVNPFEKMISLTMFRTEVPVTKNGFKISYQSPMLSVGSCFADSLGDKLVANKFDLLKNPAGTLFNPLSIFEFLSLSMERSEIIEQAVLQQDDLYLNYKFHSSFRAGSKHALLKKIENALDATRQRLLEADIIFITLGTAWSYTHKSTQMTVANCHKTPQSEFVKKLLSVEDIMGQFFNFKEMLQSKNPEVEYVFSVSPVRHTKETLRLNNVSKSVLLMACHYMTEMDEHLHYFPAYEILMDDLRDYRFYEKDLIHPNDQAIDYIWEFLIKGHLQKNDFKTYEKWCELKKALQHKPFNPKTKAHQKFLNDTLSELGQLADRLPLQNELEQLKKAVKK